MKLRQFLMGVLILSSLTPLLNAEEVGIEILEPSATADEKGVVVIPIVGAMESTGAIAGTVVSVTGVGQPAAQLVGFGAYSVNDSYITFLGYYNFALSERWAMDIQGLQAEFMDSELFLDPVSTGSLLVDEDEPLDGSYLQRDWYLTIRYLISQDTESAARLRLHDGLPVQPERGERTVFEIEPFYRTRDVRSSETDNIEGETYGVSFILDRDTRDFSPSPSRGYHTYAKLHRDWGSSDRAAYTKWEAQYSHYLDLGRSSRSKQRTLALTAYLSDIPTWRNDDPNRQPDWFAQSVLGGQQRLRGYDNDRFSDRSALFYGVEYRTVPKWQPQTTMPYINRYDFPWWQFALFAEMGKVESRFDLGDLHKDMEWSAGFGVRVFIEGIVARADIGFSDEDNILRFTVNQAF